MRRLARLDTRGVVSPHRPRSSPSPIPGPVAEEGCRSFYPFYYSCVRADLIGCNAAQQAHVGTSSNESVSDPQALRRFRTS